MKSDTFAEVQHQLLLFTADHCEDTMEHCKLLLLLLQKFPSAVSTYGVSFLNSINYFILKFVFCYSLD